MAAQAIARLGEQRPITKEADMAVQQETLIPAGVWEVDPVHSTIEFRVRNMGIVMILGYFEDFEGRLESDGEHVHVTGRVRTASVNTRNEKRDAHLRSPEFFDAEHDPEITFETKKVEATAENAFRAVGDITIKGVTREVEFDGRVDGTVDDPWGNERVGVSAHGTVNRRDFGLNWDTRAPAGEQLASDEVVIELHLGAVKQK
jgi:polyisoprenoid-binding protein YceI